MDDSEKLGRVLIIIVVEHVVCYMSIVEKKIDILMLYSYIQ